METPNTRSIKRRLTDNSRRLAKRIVTELSRLNIAELLGTQEMAWFISRQRSGDAPALVRKLIEVRLSSFDEEFFHKAPQPASDLQDFIEMLSRTSKSRHRATEMAAIHAENRLVRDFLSGYCNESSAIDWLKVLSHATRSFEAT